MDTISGVSQHFHFFFTWNIGETVSTKPRIVQILIELRPVSHLHKFGQLCGSSQIFSYSEIPSQDHLVFPVGHLASLLHAMHVTVRQPVCRKCTQQAEISLQTPKLVLEEEDTLI